MISRIVKCGLITPYLSTEVRLVFLWFEINGSYGYLWSFFHNEADLYLFFDSIHPRVTWLKRYCNFRFLLFSIAQFNRCEICSLTSAISLKDKAFRLCKALWAHLVFPFLSKLSHILRTSRTNTSSSKNSGDVNLPARIPILPISNLKSCDPWVNAIKK